MSCGMTITGLVVSLTVINCLAVETFPFSSLAVQLTSVVPTGKSAGALLVIFTLKISSAVAVPMETAVLLPSASLVMFAGIVSTGLTVSTTITFCVAVMMLLFASVAVHVTFVVPIGNSFGASLTTMTGKISVADAPVTTTGVFTAAASTTISPCTVSTGLVVSFTVIFCTCEEVFPTGSTAVHFTVVVPIG
ncbi:hypothetical protein D3C73_892330 [compost metagenome]